jgi:hypothetical protein
MSFDCLQTNPLAPCGNDPVSYVIERVFPLVIYRCLFLLALARVVRVSVCLQLAYVAMYECAPQSWQNGVPDVSSSASGIQNQHTVHNQGGQS